LEHFGKDGEAIYERTQFLILLFAIEVVTQEWSKPEESPENSGNLTLNQSLLWHARYSMIYNDILTSSVVHLQDASLNCYAKYV